MWRSIAVNSMASVPRRRAGAPGGRQAPVDDAAPEAPAAAGHERQLALPSLHDAPLLALTYFPTNTTRRMAPIHHLGRPGRQRPRAGRRLTRTSVPAVGGSSVGQVMMPRRRRRLGMALSHGIEIEGGRQPEHGHQPGIHEGGDLGDGLAVRREHPDAQRSIAPLVAIEPVHGHRRLAVGARGEEAQRRALGERQSRVKVNYRLASCVSQG